MSGARLGRIWDTPWVKLPNLKISEASAMRTAFTYIDRERAAMVSAESVSVGKYRNQQRSVHLQKATQHRFFIRQGQPQQLWNDLSLRILAANASVHP